MDAVRQGGLDIDLAAINDVFAVIAEEDPTASPSLPERGPDDRARHLERVGRH
jgi:hypothetical protein